MGRFYHGGDFLRWMGANRPYGGDFTIWYSLLGGDVAILDGDSARGRIYHVTPAFSLPAKEKAVIDMYNDTPEDIHVTNLRFIFQEYDAQKETYSM